MRSSSRIHGRGNDFPRSAFTLIEILIVITIIGILVALVVGVSSKVSENQKRSVTQTVMRNAILAIDQFKEDDPLKSVYDAKDRQTFGAYPPYSLKDNTDNQYPPKRISKILEFDFPNPRRNTLRNRLLEDLSVWDANGSSSTRPEVQINELDIPNHDVRALYTYLRVFNKAGLGQIPEKNLKPLPTEPNKPEYVNTSVVRNGQKGQQNRMEVLGIYDGWGVPLDYFLYVKLELGVVKDASGNPVKGWRIVDRTPVLRSKGVSAEELKARNGQSDPRKWIFSTPFPSPAANSSNANFWRDGVFSQEKASENGWARAVGEGETYGYVPDSQEK